MGWLERAGKMISILVKKVISGIGTITITAFGYTVVVVYSEAAGFQLGPESVDALAKMLVALLIGLAGWKSVTTQLRQALEITTEAQEKELEEKSEWDLF